MKTDRQAKAEDIANEMAKLIPDGVSSVLDLEENFVEDPLDLDNINDELTQEDIDDSFGGALDDCISGAVVGGDKSKNRNKTDKDGNFVKEASPPVASMVCDAITELSESIGGVQDKLSRKLSIAAEARPELAGTVLDIQSDVQQFIQMLSEKLLDKEEAIVTDYEKQEAEMKMDRKKQMLDREQEMMKALKEEQQNRRDLLNAAKIADLKLEFASTDEEDEEEEDEEPEAGKEGIEADKQEAESDEESIRETVKSPDLDKIPEENENSLRAEEPAPTKEKKVKKQRTAEEKEARKAKKEAKKAKREAREAEKAKKAEAKKNETTGEKLQKRRKTSASKKLNKLRTDDRALHLPDSTPAPDFSVTAKDFLAAASNGKVKVLIKYLHDGGEVNKQDEHKRTALQRAALYGEEEVIDLLVSKKAKMNLSDKLGDTALHWACRGGHPAVIKKLVKSGAKINAKDKLFSTPLHVAVRCGVQESVESLIELGADLHAKDREGDTPMHDAVRLGKFKMIKTLLQAGANIKLKNANKQTPVDMVQLWVNECKNAQADQLMAALTGTD